MADYQISTANLIFKNLQQKPVAFFCAEYGLDDSLPLYAGGLGVLAGDFVMEAGAQGLPFVALGLLYQHSFATYSPQGRTNELTNNPEAGGFALLRNDAGESIQVAVPARGRTIRAQVWVRAYDSAHVFLLDPNIETNSEDDRRISAYLYPPEPEIKLLQSLLLGVGGIELLEQLGLQPSIYHLNEGHTAMAILGLIAQYLTRHPEAAGVSAAIEKIRPQLVGTKHTILAAAGLFIDKHQLAAVLGDYLTQHKIGLDDFFNLGQSHDDPNIFSTTSLLLRSASRSSAVSLSHAIFEKRAHPNSRLIPITNGINHTRWTLPALAATSVSALSDAELWQLHSAQRRELFAAVKKQTGIAMNEDALTIVWAKRIAAYKRLDVLVGNPDRLAELTGDAKHPVNIIIAGNASINDPDGRRLLDRVIGYTKDPRFAGRLVYLPDYSITMAQNLVRGADLWLNTPLRGNEACGTSSMKAGLNGSLQFSTSDGWIDEVDLSDKGWVLPVENVEDSFYDILQMQVIPLFYARINNVPADWVKRMRLTMDIVSSHYTTRRMLQEYLNRLYFPAAAEIYKLYE